MSSPLVPKAFMGSSVPLTHEATASTRSTNFYTQHHKTVAERLENLLGRIQEYEHEESPLKGGSGLPDGIQDTTSVNDRRASSSATNAQGGFTRSTPLWIEGTPPPRGVFYELAVADLSRQRQRQQYLQLQQQQQQQQQYHQLQRQYHLQRPQHMQYLQCYHLRQNYQLQHQPQQQHHQQQHHHQLQQQQIPQQQG